jgi:hypothetical protein
MNLEMVRESAHAYMVNFNLALQALDTTDYFMVKIFEGVKNNFQNELKVNLYYT